MTQDQLQARLADRRPAPTRRPPAPPVRRGTKPLRNLATLAMSALVLLSSVAIASHVGTPTVSTGGEMAYVRDFGPDAAARAMSGDRVVGSYVSYAVRADGASKDTLVDWSSRGRIADTPVFQRIELPDGALTSRAPVAVGVQQYASAMMVHCWQDGRFAALNGVNAGFAVQATRTMDVTLHATAQFDLVEATAGQVTMSYDGHRYVLDLVGMGVLQVNGSNIRATLAAGAELRGWIDGEYPATTTLMHGVFDHLAAANSC